MNKVSVYSLFCSSLATGIVSLIVMLYNYKISATYPLLFGTLLMTLIEWPLIMTLIIYKFKNNISFFEYTTYLDGLIYFIFLTTTNIIMVNTSIIGGCLSDYPRNGIIPDYLSDDFKMFYHFLIILSVIHFVFLITWSIFTRKRDQVNNTTSDLNEIITRTRGDYIIFICVIIISLLLFALDLLILIENRSLFSDGYVLSYLYGWLSILETPLLIILLCYHLYTKTRINFKGNFLVMAWILVVLLTFILNISVGLMAGSCISPYTYTKIIDTNIVFYIWTIFVIVVNFLIYNVYLWKTKPAIINQTNINNEENAKPIN